jgi:hypothetical protein
METTRCPHCDALLPQNATVCQLCHADFRSPHRVARPSGQAWAAVAVEARVLPPVWMRAVTMILIAIWFIEGLLMFMGGLSTVSDLTRVTPGQSFIGMVFTIFGLVLIVGSSGLLMSQRWAITTMLVLCWSRFALSILLIPILGGHNLLQSMFGALVALIGIWILGKLRDYY